MRHNPFTPVADIEPVRSAEKTEQTKRLLAHLKVPGNTITFMQARDLGITHLNQRIAELQAHDVRTYQRQIRLYNTPCMEYSLYPFHGQAPEGDQ